MTLPNTDEILTQSVSELPYTSFMRRVRLKGNLAKRQPETLVNISQIRTISQYNYIHDPPNQTYTLIELTSNSIIYTHESYLALKDRIQLTRNQDGPHALIEIITVTHLHNDNTKTTD